MFLVKVFVTCDMVSKSCYHYHNCTILFELASCVTYSVTQVKYLTNINSICT